MRYCRRCVLPDTRPGLALNADGVCSGCAGHALKPRIDWAARRRDLKAIVARAKMQSSGYDCIIPVSGGKDSTWQTIRCLEMGLRVLAVTWRSPGRTELGQRNLDNLISLGVDHIDYSIAPGVERKFTYQALLRTGSSAVPMHMALYSIPLRIACDLRVPLVVWGESPHMEYGGSRKDRAYNRLDPGWFKRHGILQGTSAADWVGMGGLTRKDLEPYFLPAAADFRRAGVESVFLGYYLPWDPVESLRAAKARGFQVRKEGPKLGYYDYADIDCDFISVHHYFKWLKFGFTRLFDNLSIEIRNGRMSRDAALRVIARTGPQVPEEDIGKLCAFLRISRGHFRRIEERFRNRSVWVRRNGRWVVKDFILPDWRWWS